MPLDQNTEYWLQRFRAENAAVQPPDRAVVAAMHVAEVEFLFGLNDAAREHLAASLQNFHLLHPGTWCPLVSRAGKLCEPLNLNDWLLPEVERGLSHLAQPNAVTYNTSLPEHVHDAALQSGRLDVAARFVSKAWPGKAVNQLLDDCRAAGFTRDAAALRRLLPKVIQAVQETPPPEGQRFHCLSYWPMRACISTGLLAEACELAELVGEGNSPGEEIIIALWKAGDQPNFLRYRDRHIAYLFDRSRPEAHQFHWRTSDIEGFAEILRRLGDHTGHRQLADQFAEVVAEWTPPEDWLACKVNCGLAFLFARAGDAARSAEYLDVANRLYQGKFPEMPTKRGNRPIMASILSGTHLHLGDVDRAIKLAKKLTHAGDRRHHLQSAYILGGRIAEADAELAELDSACDRTHAIGSALRYEFYFGHRTLPPL